MDNQIRRVLIVTEGPNQGQSYALQEMICTLGRTADNTVVIDSPRISRHHTQIRLLPEGAIVEDMGSTNGTWLNNRRLTSPQRLMPGDIIGLADYVTFRFEVEEEVWTEKLIPAMPGAPTQVMDDVYSTPVPPPPRGYQEPYRQYAEPETPPFVPAQSAPPAALQPIVAPRAKRPQWVYIVVAILLVLICICAAVAVYLWFAPVEFWEKVFELFNIPIP
ncbi:MAG TPA: FHA domain-containing protein [Anaerolineae bacterium]|nr:FHA domain-containing protein [Anaerolineae bacterium]HQI84515.1 FHA domain-containing protein [Anaerolineae bacterium]